MRTALIILLTLLVAHGSKSQTLPVNIDLISNGNRLNAKVYPAESVRIS
jgi:hypothetical protein